MVSSRISLRFPGNRLGFNGFVRFRHSSNALGRGGKKDDTSCVVAEIVEWTDEMKKAWTPKPDTRKQLFPPSFSPFFTCFVAFLEVFGRFRWIPAQILGYKGPAGR